jgi:hypothetical protein
MSYLLVIVSFLHPNLSYLTPTYQSKLKSAKPHSILHPYLPVFSGMNVIPAGQKDLSDTCFMWVSPTKLHVP